MIQGYGGASRTTPKTTLSAFRCTPCLGATNANTETIAYTMRRTHTGDSVSYTPLTLPTSDLE